MARTTKRFSAQGEIFRIIFEAIRQKHTDKRGFTTRAQLASALRDGNAEKGLVTHDEMMEILEKDKFLQTIADYGEYGGRIGNMKEWFSQKITVQRSEYTNDVIRWQATTSVPYAYMPMPKACVDLGCKGYTVVGYTEAEKLACAHFSHGEFLRKRRQ
jgi:hypothetical protein